MDTLELKFLGDLRVLREGRDVPLPPSRKTRALLAYLALNARRFRREHLCELLWEVPDDPRGSLRWSLSKLRRLVDAADRPRIVADRSHVEFDAGDVACDVLRLRELAGSDLSSATTESLESAAREFSGHFLEGLELSNFHEFQAWCIAERELVTRAQSDLLGELIERKRGDPETALPHARDLVSLVPYSESARETLIRLLVATGRADEARQQYLLGARMLKEAGARPTGALTRALESQPETASVASMDEPPAGDAAGAVTAVQEPAPGSVAPGPLTAVFGRRAEILQLSSTIEAAIASREARVLLMRGEPGIGKSRLLHAAAELAERAGAWVLEACAFESESIRPFAIWIDALRQRVPEAADRIFGPREGENRERLLAGLSDLISEQAQRKPVVLLLDDMQWCDESSATALHYVVRTNRQLPIIVVLSAREGEIQDNAAFQQALGGMRHAGLIGEMPLAPLPEAAVRELIESRAPGVDSAALARECGGNPLIAIELARAELSGDAGDSLRELMRERLARFDVDAGEVLRWAAVLSPRIDIGLLKRVSDTAESEIDRALELAERQGMLQPATRGVRFSHDLIAKSIYADISPSRRRMMHRRVAEALEQDTALELEHAADLAHHAGQSGDPGLAARAMVSAGRLCLRFFANDEALARAQRGLKFAESLPAGERVRLTIDLNDIILAAAPLEDWRSAAEDYVALAEQALDHGALSHARRGYYMASFVRWMHGQWTGAREEMLLSERVARGGSDEDQIVGMAEAARCLALLERDLSQADAMLMEAQSLASRKRVAHHAIPAALGMLRYHENRFDDAEALFNEARTLAKSAGERISEYQANEYLVMIAIERGDFALAGNRCRALLEIGSKLRQGSEAPFAQALDAICRYAGGADADGVRIALDELRAMDAKHRLAYALTRAALIDLARGDARLAVERGSEALQHATVLERATDMLLAHVVLARAYRALEDSAAAGQHAQRIGELESAQVAEWARQQAREALS